MALLLGREVVPTFVIRPLKLTNWAHVNESPTNQTLRLCCSKAKKKADNGSAGALGGTDCVHFGGRRAEAAAPQDPPPPPSFGMPGGAAKTFQRQG
eukprot:gene9705-8656_t